MAGEQEYLERLREMGSEIRTRRESLGISVTEASDRTKIRAKYLTAVEEGDESPAPGTTYFKAFLKTYATFLGLDGLKYSQAYQEILDLRAAPPSKDAKPAAPKPAPAKPEAPKAPRALEPSPKAEASSHRPVRRPRKAPRPALWAFVLFFAVALMVYVVVENHKAAPATPAPPTSTEPTTPPASTPPVASPPPEPSSPKIVRTDPDKENTLITVDRTPVELTLRTSKESDSYCWISVSLDGKAVYEKTLSPGQEEKISAKSEIVVRAGKPWVITLTVNGKDVGVGGEFGPVKDLVVRSVPKTQ